MLNRGSIAVLLTAVIGVLATVLVTLLGLNTLTAWREMQIANRIEAVATISADVFRAMHTLRAERAVVGTQLIADSAVSPELLKYLEEIQGRELPAINGLFSGLASLSLAEGSLPLSEFEAKAARLKDLRIEATRAIQRPKSERRQALTKEYQEAAGAVFGQLETFSARLANEIVHADATIDALLNIKQLAWMARNAAGDASLLVYRGLTADKFDPELSSKYIRAVGVGQGVWDALANVASLGGLPERVPATLARTKSVYLDPEYLGLRDRLMQALINGTKPEMNGEKFSFETIPRMGSAVELAETALDAGRDRASQRRLAAVWSLATQMALLVIAVSVALASMWAIRRRVLLPLHSIRDAMLKVAAGDLDTEAPYAENRDEIGALAGALVTFRQNAIEKHRNELDEQSRASRTAARQQLIEEHIARFEARMQDTLDALGEASRQMGQTSASMSSIAEQTSLQVREAVQASGEASSSVQSVAAATEELSSSINDISRRASQAASVAGRCVAQAEETDGTVQGLSQSAGRISEVVQLINGIAEQTNLLALNATIEAARAGEAGRGFSVVASEVKALATQTAKATEEISQQIVAVQKVAAEAVEAIKGIGGTIAEVSEVATSIAAAVEEQGAATAEITRNTQMAAGGTQRVTDNMAGVSTGAEATGSAAHDVQIAAAALQERARELRGEVSEFLNAIRAA